MHGGQKHLGDGYSLLPLMRLEANRRTKPLFAEQLPYPSFQEYLVAGINPQGSKKVIYNLSKNQRLAFDLSTDPDEKTPISETEAQNLEALDFAIKTFLESK